MIHSSQTVHEDRYRGGKLPSTLLYSLAGVIIKLIWHKLAKESRLKFNGMCKKKTTVACVTPVYMRETQENWVVTCQNGGSHHFNYHLHMKTK